MVNIEQQIMNVIDEQKWLDTFGEKAQEIVKGIFESAGPAGSKIADFLHGTWLKHPVHSVITDVPVGSYTAAVLLDIASESTGNEDIGKAADMAVGLGVLASVGAAVTGITDWHHTYGHSRRVGVVHLLLNTTALILYILSWVFRRQKNRQLGVGLSLLGYGIVSAGAYLGGHLVYTDKIGVDHSPNIGLPKKFTPVMADVDLPEGKLTRAEVNNIPVLLVRRNGRVLAIGEVCSHLGGPLSKGELKDNVVVCPWHGSHFSLEDGHLVGGPSVYDQVAFETRVRNGQIEVRYKQTEHS
jgi:nitrite reductase/ring-hydroxylating ferredoxin subunit/uncharacterized membrane protein